MKKWLNRLYSNLLKLNKKIKRFARYLFSSQHQSKLILILLISLFFPIQNSSWHQTFSIYPSPTRLYPKPAQKIQQVMVSNNVPAPYLSAAGVYVVDLNQNSLLYDYNSDKHYYPASTTKLVTAMIASQHYRPDDVISVAARPVIGQVLGIQPGEQYRFQDLLYGLLIHSGNDAAETLAANYTGGYYAFINQMNQIVHSYQLTNTHFVNPTGLDAWQNYTTPHDLAVISQHALANNMIAQIVSTKDYQIADVTDSHFIKLSNINELLGQIKGMKGVKTGWTELAGECLVSYVEHNDMKILGVIMYSSDRFGDTRRLITWVEDNFYLKSL